jgi:hypothetical protein
MGHFSGSNSIFSRLALSGDRSARPLARMTLTAALAAGILITAAAPARADGFSPQVTACRAAIGKSSIKLTKAALKAVTGCYKARARDAAFSTMDCSDIDVADTRHLVSAAATKFTSAVNAACSGVDPEDALYIACPPPCYTQVPSLSSMSNVASCLVCLAQTSVEALSQEIHGTPDSPLSSGAGRCDSSVGKSTSKLFQTVMRDVTSCQALNEKSGETSVDFCTQDAFPRPASEDALFDAENSVVNACDIESFAGLDSCASSQFGIAYCTGDATLESSQEFVTQVLALPVVTTTTTTTTTTLPQDPQCPDLGELVLYAHDTNISCTTNDDCVAPRTCNAAVGICQSSSDLDSGWTGLAHNSDLNEDVITLSRLHCDGPAPTCGECTLEGLEAAYGNCRCVSNSRTICDEPFANDADDCGGGACECFFGVPIPLSSGGTPACIVNRYAEDIRGTANVDEGSSSITAHLRTRVYLGVSTTNPCPVCAGVCSNNPTGRCLRDSDCGSGNTCIQDVPNDGVRGGLCLNGSTPNQACDVGGINPSFPAISGNIEGGGGYSLDCMPSVGINISGVGLDLNVTQTTGTSVLESTLPCDGGNCACKTCSADEEAPCNKDSDCIGASCAISNEFSCSDNGDCDNLDLGNCTSIGRCSKAIDIDCSTNTDCKGQDGGACEPSTCIAFGGAGTAPRPNGCIDGVCADADSDGNGLCITGPDDKYCDGLVRADNSGILTCNSNSDCQANNPLNGLCTLVQRRACFMEPIVATGTASTQFPVGAATFCVPPTANGSINLVAGLPGPARVLNQGRSRAFCASDHNVEYQAGAGNCPAP